MTSRRRSSAAIFRSSPIPTTTTNTLRTSRELKETYGHAGSDILHGADTVLDVQARGEYLYAALGKGGLRIYDIANDR